MAKHSLLIQDRQAVSSALALICVLQKHPVSRALLCQCASVRESQVPGTVSCTVSSCASVIPGSWYSVQCPPVQVRARFLVQCPVSSCASVIPDLYAGHKQHTRPHMTQQSHTRPHPTPHEKQVKVARPLSPCAVIPIVTPIKSFHRGHIYP
uniref:Uncharacterized protein n=1 Tax=Branchiostoma floridae TaxID=7739 RepID=C3ZZ09_BRAFL|eukprot:XP_002586200.1 hypothetical protein BRAFLDRAFT_109561 [Branchiostoma floridae]